MAETLEQKPNYDIIGFIWNKEDRTFCGRNYFSWLLIGGFFIALYACLAAFLAVCMIVHLETIDNTEPKWYGLQSLTHDNPGLGMRPMPVYDTTLIRFQQGKPSSYKPYTDHMEAFLQLYEDENQVGRDLIDCEVAVGWEKTKPREQACRVDLDKVLGKTTCSKAKDYGYEDGEPCILLKMNRVYGFVPEPYVDLEELLQDNNLAVAPRFLAFTPNLTVGVSCEGENAADRENIHDGGIEFFPKQDGVLEYEGFPLINYPFLNQEGYRSPFIMVKFTKFTKRVVIQVVCKLYAKNIDNRGTAQRHGTLRFELLKD